MLPEHFTSMEEEYRALVTGGGVTLDEAPDHLEMAGEDRVRFLNGQVTCDVRNLASDQGVFGFFTDARGRVLSEVVVRSLPERLLLELPPGTGESIREHMSRYVIADRVEIAPVGPFSRLRWLGPDSGARLSRLLGVEMPPVAWGHAPARLAGHDGRLGATAGTGEYELLLDRPAARALFEGWVAGGAPVGWTLVGRAALEARRVEIGRLLFGVDYGGDHFPQETGREEGVSYQKGCYLGQEVVARIHYRGGVNRFPRGLLFSGGELPAAGALLHRDGSEVGRATSVAHSPALGRGVGLALVHRKAAEPGTRLEVAGGGEAEVAELPLAGGAL